MLFEWGSGERTVIMVGHYDTVWPIGAKPIEYEGDILKGSGSSDMKCGIVAEIWILKAITDLGLPCDKKVCHRASKGNRALKYAHNPCPVSKAESYLFP
jgi:glutamate carboxypeptidase